MKGEWEHNRRLSIALVIKCLYSATSTQRRSRPGSVSSPTNREDFRCMWNRSNDIGKVSKGPR